MARYALGMALVAAAFGLVIALEHEPCTEGACDSEATSLLQRKVDSGSLGSRQLPGWDALKDVASDVLGDAKAAAVEQALSALSDSLNSTLGSLEALTDNYSLQMKDGQRDWKAGMTAILAERFHVNQTSLYRDMTQFVENVDKKVEAADKLWGRICTAGQTLQATLGTALTAMNATKFKDQVNETLQAANTKCSEVETKLNQLHTLLAPVTPTNASEASAGPSAKGMMLQLHDEDPLQVCHDMNDTLQGALKQVQGFADTFNGAFGALTTSVGGAFQDQLSAASLAKVHDSFAGLGETVAGITGGAVNGTVFFLTGLQDGVGVAGLAAGVKSAASEIRGGVPGCVLAVVLAAFSARA